MNYWTLQNAITLKQHHLEKIIGEVKAIKDIKLHYFEVIADPMLQEFGALICEIQKGNNEYEDYITEQYYFFLARVLFYD